MKIAITYDNGQVFQHFGRTELFKVYEVEGSEILSSEIIGSNGTGHGALAGLLAAYDIDVLICGGIGGGAQEALMEAGIQLVAGASGNVDEVVAAFLAGELENTGANCDHHHHEEGHECCGGHGHHEGEDHECCGGHGHEEGEEHHCCCGGKRKPAFEGKNVGKTCRTHYRGTFNDGTQFDSSYDRGEPLEFVCGAGMMIKGYDAAVANMEVGESIDIHLMPEEAYGPSNPAMIMTFPIAQMPGAETLSVGQHVYLSNSMGQPFPVVVAAMTDTTITFDANHEMAGKELNFHIELVSVE